MITKLLNNPKIHLKIFLVILAGCIFLLLGRLYMTGSAIGGDAVHYYISLRSIVIDRDLNFDNEYEYFYNQRSVFTGNRKVPYIPDKNPVTARLPAKYPIGNAIFLIPPYLLTHISLLTLHKLGINVATNGYGVLYQASAAIGSLIYAFLGLLLIYNLGKKIFEPKVAFPGTLFIWLATPLIYYMTMEPLSSQPISFFSVSAFIYLWYSTRKNRKFHHWIMLGIVGGLMSMVRYQDALFLLIPIIDSFKKLSGNISRTLVFIFFAGLGLSVQFAVNNYLYGSLFHASVYGDMSFPFLTSPKILYTLFSLERGLFVWSPILIFAVIGLYWFRKSFKFIGSLLVLSVFLQVYLISSWVDPGQGDSFGNRILINSNSIFALGLMQFIEKTKSNGKLLLIIFTLLALVNGILAVLFIFRFIGQPY